MHYRKTQDQIHFVNEVEKRKNILSIIVLLRDATIVLCACIFVYSSLKEAKPVILSNMKKQCKVIFMHLSEFKRLKLIICMMFIKVRHNGQPSPIVGTVSAQEAQCPHRITPNLTCAETNRDIELASGRRACVVLNLRISRCYIFHSWE